MSINRVIWQSRLRWNNKNKEFSFKGPRIFFVALFRVFEDYTFLGRRFYEKYTMHA